MRSIYKYDIIEDTDNNGYVCGPITKILTAQVQHGTIKIWAEVDTDAPMKKYHIVPIGTGWPIMNSPDGTNILDTYRYISTVQLSNGALIFHVYAREIVETTTKNKPSPEKKEDKKVVDAEKSNSATFTITKCTINPEVLAHFIR